MRQGYPRRRWREPVRRTVVQPPWCRGRAMLQAAIRVTRGVWQHDSAGHTRRAATGAGLPAAGSPVLWRQHMRRPRRQAPFLAAAVLLGWPAAAGAASATLTVKTERGFVVTSGKKAGLPAYRALYKWSVQFRGKVVNDAGAPANGVQVTLWGVDGDGAMGPIDGPHLTFSDG